MHVLRDRAGDNVNALTEYPLRFACGNDWLFGLLHAPKALQIDTGLVVVVGGPQYRAGSHRQFTHLARHCAQGGVPTLRFDVRGMGDSTGDLRSFEELDDDIAAAIDEFQRRCAGVRRVVLWGLCDGASASLLYVNRRGDPRVSGMVLLNPWVRTPQGLARTHARHYYRRRLLQPSFWRKLLHGEVGLGAAGDWLRTRRLAQQPRTSISAGEGSFVERMASAWLEFKGPLLLVLSGDDFVAKEFLELSSSAAQWSGSLARPQLSRLDLETANHTFSGPADKAEVAAATLGWVLACASRPMASAATAGGCPEVTTS
jgi:exosortase A-associated hydrolase 1